MSKTPPLPSRWQAPSLRPVRQKRNLGIAACGRLQHLQAVATWAAAEVPPLGAFLGAHLASTCQFLRSPPPSSSNSTCQRCESILQIGVNCSVRVRSRKKKKKSLVNVEGSPTINCVSYFCHYCTFENINSGTPIAYVKTKLSEMAARHKLAELNQALGEKTPKSSDKVRVSDTKVVSMESDRSSGKKSKRKGWLSLKQLSTSAVDSSPTGSKPILVKSTISTVTHAPKLDTLLSLKSTSKFSRLPSENVVTPVSRIKGQCALYASTLKFNLKPTQTNKPSGAAVLEENLNWISSQRDSVMSAQNSLSFTTNVRSSSALPELQETGLTSPIRETASTSIFDVTCVSNVYNIGLPESNCAIAVSSPQKLECSDIIMEGYEKDQLSHDQSGHNANELGRLTIASVERNLSLELAAHINSSTTVSQPSTKTLSHSQGLPISSSPTSTSKISSILGSPSGASLKVSQSPSKEEHAVLTVDEDMRVHSRSSEPTKLVFMLQNGPNKVEHTHDKERQPLTKRRKLDGVWLQNTAKKQKPAIRNNQEDNLNTKEDKVLSNSIQVRRSKMKPLFWRMGGQWFIRCQSKKIRWRHFYTNTRKMSRKKTTSLSSSMNTPHSIALNASRSPSNQDQENITPGINMSHITKIPVSLWHQHFLHEQNQVHDKKSEFQTKKRKTSAQKRFYKVAKKKRQMMPYDLNDSVDASSCKLTQNVASERDIKSKMKPLFWRKGRHWLTKCRSTKIEWRLI